MTSDFNETLVLQWKCPACTLLNVLDLKFCSICNQNRPLDQYVNLFEIQQQQKRSKIEQEEFNRELAMNMNMNSIKNNSKLTEEEEEEAARLLLEQDNEEWNEEDFDDDGEWDENMDNNDSKYDEMKTDTEMDDGGWNNTEIISHSAAGNLIIKMKKVTFEIFSPYKLQEYQNSILKEIQDSLDIENIDDVATLCRYYRWNHSQFLDNYLKNPSQVLVEAGVKTLCKIKPSKKSKFDCFLCIRTVDISQVFHLGCGHQFCNECWAQYLSSEMDKGPKVVLTRCIEPKCTKIVSPDIFNRFLPFKHRTKFTQLILHSFVVGRAELAWCPGSDCINAGKAEVGIPVTIECTCQHLWCFSCREVGHVPCNCDLARKWINLAMTDSENLVYVRAYTKQCPKCKNHIEKNQGCNHMTCRCGYEFCWLCKIDWVKNGYGHQCNKPQKVMDEENDQKLAESYLKRYMFYYDRYEAHGKSAQMAIKSIKNAQKCVRSFIIGNGRTYNNFTNDVHLNTMQSFKYSDLQFIVDAIQETVRTRRILQWSYCYGYYLQDKCLLKEMFEIQQGLLESFGDHLHEKAEKKVDDENQWQCMGDLKFRTELITLTKTVTRYRQNLCDALMVGDFIFQKGITKHQPKH